MNKPQTWETLREQINRTLEREGKTVADLAQDIGVIYIVAYRWLKVEKSKDSRTPNAASMFKLMDWLTKQTAAK